MEYPGVRLGQRGGLFDLYQYYLGGGDQSDDGPVTTDPFPGAGGDATNTMGVELSRIKQPTGSPFRSDIPQMDFFASLPKDDPRYMSAADQIFLQNRADAGEFSYDSPYYIGGAPGNIVQSGPGRQFTGDEAMFVGDPREKIQKDEDERFSFASLRQSIMDNPLLRGVSAIASPAGALAQGAVGILQGLFPATNERAILERRARDQGIAVDDIGRVAFQDFGKGPDGKTIALGAYDPSGVNIMAGYNLSKITQETIDKRRARAKKNMSPEGFEEFNTALTAFEEMYFGEDKIKDNTEEEIKRREYIDREKKREKIQEDLAAAGFGEAGAVGLSDDMDKQIFDDYTYTPPSKDDKPPQAPLPKPKQTYSRSYNPGAGGVVQHGGGGSKSSGSKSSKSSGSKSSRPGGSSSWGRTFHGANGGIVDLL